MAPADLLRAAHAEVRRYGVEIIEDRVVDATAGFALRLAGGRTVEARHVLLASGAVDELLAGGLLRTDADGRTSVPGVWAAGNAANPRAQVITAAGEGSAVAIAINTELVKEDVETATAVPGHSHCQMTSSRAGPRKTQPW